MNVLFMAQHLRTGGAQRFFLSLLPLLAERGLAVRGWTLDDEGEFFHALRRTGVAMESAGMRGRLDLPTVWRVARSVGTWPDVVVTHDIRAHVVGRILARKAGAAHVGLDFGGTGLRHKPHRAVLTRLVAPGFDWVVTDNVLRVGDLRVRGFPPSRTSVIAGGVPRAERTSGAERARSRQALGIADDAFVALLLAMLRPEKRPVRFVHAIAAAAASEPRIVGLSAGYGPERESVDAAVAETGAPVRVLGYRDDVEMLLRASDVLCLTSETEGVSFAVLEAMAVGVPVVAFAVGAMPDVVASGETGVLVPDDDSALAEALVGLARAPVRLASFGVAAQRRQQEHYGVDRMADAYLALFADVTSGASTSRSRAATTSSS